MNEEAAFLKAIKKSPKDRTARLVFADWLQERDDPRADWVRDDDIWEWMRPDAKDPREAIVQAVKKGDQKAYDLIDKLGPHVIPTLLAALKGAGRSQAFRLRGVLGGFKTAAEAVLPAILAAADNPHPAIRGGAMTCLEHLVATNETARKRVLADLKHKDQDVRYAAAWTLVEVGPAGAPAVSDLIRLLRDKEGSWPASRVLKSIGSPAGEAAIPELMRLFVKGSNAVEHWYDVRYALAAMGAASVKALLATAPTSKERAFADLVDTLTEIGPAALPELQKAAKHKDANTRQAVKEALTRLTPKASIDLLRDPDPKVVERTLHHLLNNVEEATPTVPALIEIIADPTRPNAFHAEALRILAQVGPAAEPAVPTLMALFPTATREFAERAAHVLDEVGRYATTTLLWLQRQPANRRQAEIECSRLRSNVWGGDRYAVRCRHTIEQAGARMRRAPGLNETVTAALTLQPAAAVAALRLALQNENDGVRLVAVVGLWHVATKEAAEVVLSALQDSQFAVRAQAADVLGYIGAGVPDVEKALRALTNDESWYAREPAKEALKRLTGKDS